MSEALIEERDFLLRSLDDLEREWAAGDIDEDDYRALRDSYTARAAAVLRALEPATGDVRVSTTTADLPRSDGGEGETGPGGVAPRRRWAPALWVVLVLGLAGVSALLVTRAAGERLPGGTATGAIADTGPSADLQRATQLVGQGKVLDAIKLYDSVLARDPKNPEALAYRGWLLRLTAKAANDPALIDTGLGYIDRAIAADPTFPDPHFFRGLILFQDKGDPAAAVKEFETYLASNPDPSMVPVVQGALEEARKAAAPKP